MMYQERRKQLYDIISKKSIKKFDIGLVIKRRDVLEIYSMFCSEMDGDNEFDENKYVSQKPTLYETVYSSVINLLTLNLKYDEETNTFINPDYDVKLHTADIISETKCDDELYTADDKEKYDKFFIELAQMNKETVYKPLIDLLAKKYDIKVYSMCEGHINNYFEDYNWIEIE